MTIEAIDFINAADEMASMGSEIWHRNACSRAYYGAFTASRHLSAGLPVPKDRNGKPIKGTHEKHAASLIASPNKDLRFIGYKLNDNRKLRQMADYDLHENITYMDARTAISECKAVLSRVEKLDGDESLEA